MATLKFKDIKNMKEDERKKKLQELKLELIKSEVNASKSGKSNKREIRKIIARLFTLK